MSFFVDREWFYYLRGREILLYKLRGGSSTQRISQSGVFQSYDNEMMYPDEDIADGLRIEYTRVSEPFVAEALETTTAYLSGTSFKFQDTSTAIYTGSSNLSFVSTGKRINFAADEIDTTANFYDGQSIVVSGTSSNNGTFTIASAGVNTNQLVVEETVVSESDTSGVIKSSTGSIFNGTAGTNTFTDFSASDKIRIRGSSSNDADYTISSVSTDGDALIVSSAPSSVESSGERVTITQIPLEVVAPSSTSHINLNKMLSLSVLDYCKGMLAEQNNDINKKEYFMKEFFSKLGDNESNKRNISVSFPSGPFAVR
tara:strand:- start:390 stop:1331 length:942 start_codon:yes stop_codon:yes gene_type:complete